MSTSENQEQKTEQKTEQTTEQKTVEKSIPKKATHASQLFNNLRLKLNNIIDGSPELSRKISEIILIVVGLLVVFTLHKSGSLADASGPIAFLVAIGYYAFDARAHALKNINEKNNDKMGANK